MDNISKKPKIVIFEDNSVISDVCTGKFRDAGFDVKSFIDPSQNPVEVIIREKPDIIYMDIIMPVMNGFDATELLKADKRTRDIPIIVVSNMTRIEDKERGLALGAEYYLSKQKYPPSLIVEFFLNYLKTKK